MNGQRVRNVRIKAVRFEYLERVRNDEFCAYIVGQRAVGRDAFPEGVGDRNMRLIALRAR